MFFLYYLNLVYDFTAQIPQPVHALHGFVETRFNRKQVVERRFWLGLTR